MRGISVLVIAAVLVSCTDSAETAQTPGDAGAKSCGPGPYVAVTGELSSYTNAEAKVAGARLTFDLCPDAAFVTGEDGRLAGTMTRGTQYNPRVEADGYIPLRSGEQLLRADFDATAPMFPRILSGLFPHLRPDAPVMFVAVAFSTDSRPAPNANDPCSTLDGYVVTIKGHPDAVVTYYAGETTPTVDPGLTATGPLGLAEVSGIAATAPGERIEPLATKPGCDRASFVSYPHTGRYVLENGVVTLAGAFLPPVSPPP